MTPQLAGRRAVFLDRDGTLIVERDYLADPAGVTLETSVGAALALLQSQGWLLVMVTNQSGVARGYFSLEDVEAVNATVESLLASEGVVMDGVWVCPHGPLDECDCRKPAPGLLIEAANTLGIDLTRSFVIGDKASDLEAARRADARAILVLTGQGSQVPDDVERWFTASTLADAADRILTVDPIG